MVFPSKVYDVLKWLLLIVVPAFITLFSFLASAWKWDIPVEAITGTITAVATFIGVCIGISNYNYYKGDEDGEAEE